MPKPPGSRPPKARCPGVDAIRDHLGEAAAAAYLERLALAAVDVGARADIYAAMRDLVDSGAGVLLISSDLPEVLNLDHRIYVITEGRVVAELSGDQLTEEIVLPQFFPQETGTTS
ncbi:hypothetical protein ACWD4L_23625 [Streptomyces sp. NPDC002596]